MHSQTRQLLDYSPLQPGEEVVVELVGIQDDLRPAGLLLTTRRLGMWNPSGRLMGPLFSVVDWSLARTRVVVHWSNGARWSVRGPSVSKSNQFFEALRRTRLSLVSPSALGAVARGLVALGEGRDWTEIAALLGDAASEERVHPGPALLHFLLLRYLGHGQEAGEAMVQNMAGWLGLDPQALALWPRTGLTAVQEFRAGLQLGLTERSEEWNLAQILFVAMSHGQPGSEEEATAWLRRALERASPEVDEQLRVVAFGTQALRTSCWAPLRETLQRLETHLRGEGEGEGGAGQLGEVQAWLRYMDYPAFPRAACEAMAEVVPAEGRPAHLACLRVLERWDAVCLDAGGPRPQAADYARMGVEAKAFGRVARWMGHYLSPEREIERAWASLRRGDWPAVAGAMWSEPGAWFEAMRTVFARGSVYAWLVGLLEVEYLLEQGMYELAGQLLERVYRTCMASFGDARDLYLLHAESLHGLYRAMIAGRDAQAMMYADLLEAEPGFGWVRALARSLAAVAREPNRAVQESEMAEFEGWLMAVREELDLRANPDFEEALEQFGRSRATQTLRVVIGGETSAGKSSFINAIVGMPVLLAREHETTAIPTVVRRGMRWRVEVVDREGKTRAALDVDQHPTVEVFNRFSHVVHTHTSVGSPASQDVAQVLLTVPSRVIPDGVEYIDTPGLNTDALRTARAQREMDGAHACIFVLDARNVLGGLDLQHIRLTRSLVAKTLFVLNKVDYLMADQARDPEAETVDTRAIDALVERARREIRKAFGVEPSLFAVCSLPPEEVRHRHHAIVPYVREIVAIRRRLSEVLVGSSHQLLARSASRMARFVAMHALDYGAQQLQWLEGELSRLLGKLPEDADTFREQVVRVTARTWQAVSEVYVERMETEYAEAFNQCETSLLGALGQLHTHADLQLFMERRLEAILREFVGAIDGARMRVWQDIGTLILADVQALFQHLYADAHMESDFDAREMLALSAPESLLESEAGIGALIAGVLRAEGQDLVGERLGAPVEAAVMARLQEVIRRCFEAIQGVILQVLNADISDETGLGAPLLWAAFEVAEHERARFEVILRQQITRLEFDCRVARQEAQRGTRQVEAAVQWAERFEATLGGER